MNRTFRDITLRFIRHLLQGTFKIYNQLFSEDFKKLVSKFMAIIYFT